MPRTWDLREQHTIDAVGWPDDQDGLTWHVEPVPDDLVIVLPEGVELGPGQWEQVRRGQRRPVVR